MQLTLSLMQWTIIKMNGIEQFCFGFLNALCYYYYYYYSSTSFVIIFFL